MMQLGLLEQLVMSEEWCEVCNNNANIAINECWSVLAMLTTWFADSATNRILSELCGSTVEILVQFQHLQLMLRCTKLCMI